MFGVELQKGSKVSPTKCPNLASHLSLILDLGSWAEQRLREAPVLWSTTLLKCGWSPTPGWARAWPPTLCPWGQRPVERPWSSSRVPPGFLTEPLPPGSKQKPRVADNCLLSICCRGVGQPERRLGNTPHTDDGERSLEPAETPAAPDPDPPGPTRTDPDPPGREEK